MRIASTLVASVSGLLGLCVSVQAKDLVQPPWRTDQMVFDWRGLYFGSHIGVGSSRTDWERATGALAAYSPFGAENVSGDARYGVQIGYNFQSGPVVIGAEADLSFGHSSGFARCALAMYVCTTGINEIGTITARLGYATGNFLWYGKGGGAWAQIDRNLTSSVITPVYSVSETRAGWTVGAGAEYAFNSALSAKIEYDYADLGRRSLTVASQFGQVADFTTSQNLHLVKLGLNYHLGAAPTLASGLSIPAGALPQWSWTGIYLGVHAGGAFGRNEFVSATAALLASSSSGGFPGGGNTEGLLAGGQIGANYQTGGWVVGLDVAAAASAIDGYAKCAQNVFGLINNACHNRITSLGTIAGRLGPTFGNLLIYGKAGAAWGAETSEISNFYAPDSYTESGTRWGWIAGSGLEYAFSRNLSAFVEYDHIDFGTRNASFASQLGNTSVVGLNQRIDLVKTGLNYRLGGGPPTLDANAADPKLFLKAAQSPAGWTIEVGARYYGSNGRMQKDLYHPFTPARLNSRLTYADQAGHAGETFFRFDHDSGIFVKGNFGLGHLVGGNLNDEDFPGAVDYSNTLSKMKDGRLMYGSADIGTNIITARDAKLGGFVGYRSFYERSNDSGCLQIATDTLCVPTDQTSFVGLSETASWRGVALGLNARMGLTDRLKLEVDAAYLPFVNREGIDNHWYRSNINPQDEPGHGWGTQFEAILSYAVSERLSVGIGGRYQFLTTTDGSTHFPTIADNSPQKQYSERYGGFLQTSYKFGDVQDRLDQATNAQAADKVPPPAPVNWSGIYIGGTIGAGLGRSRYADPFPAPVWGDDADLGGATAGGQFGANYQAGSVVVGGEIAASWADIQGSNTCFAGFPNASLAGFNCGSRIDAIGAFTARIGYAWARALVYARGGLALDHQRDEFNTTGVGGTIQDHSSTNWGWIAGGGLEYALTPRWSVALDYKYYDFGKSGAFTTTALPELTNINLAPASNRIQTFTMGVNYRFAPIEWL